MADILIKKKEHWITLDSSLGEDTLLATRFEAEESISKLFRYRLDLLSPRDDIKPEEILGESVTVNLRRPEGKTRHFNGIVVRFAAGPKWIHNYRHYDAELVPQLWFLTRTTDCRIFEKKTVKQIIEEIFGEMGVTDYDTSGIKGHHPEREYCVQYRETDFNFVSRLLEEEGIYYFFKHEKGKHTLVLADSNSAFVDSDDKEVGFHASNRKLKHYISRWGSGYNFRSGKYVQRDYNFETPKDKLETNKNTIVKVPKVSKYELFDYPGLYFKKKDGDEFTKVHMEEDEAHYAVVNGESDCRGFSPGHKFQLTSHDYGSEEGKYVVTGVRHVASDYAYLTTEAPLPDYQNSFTCIPDSVAFRPPRVTPKPVVHGPHTAFVTGPSGEEIHTDEYARIRVQFHWEREDKKSCWSRVLQSWAGKKWGTQFIPRIGMEVVVEFLEGDPDRPIVTGCVYNADYMPPYTLTGNKTQSGWKSRSSTGGGDADFNELRFEDKKGSEEIYFHAEKDFKRVVENNDSLKVGMDKKSPGKQDIEIWGDRTTAIKQGNDDLTLDMGSKSTKVKLGSITYEAFQKIELKVGMSKITIDMTQIKLEAPMIMIQGQIMTTVKAPMTMVQGDGVMTVKGGVTLVTGTPCAVTGPPLVLG